MQKNADESKHNTVVLLLQDMLEVVTRDMMVNEIRLVILTTILNTGYLYFFIFHTLTFIFICPVLVIVHLTQ